MKNTIKVERAKKDWTQADLGEKIGVSRQAINSIETGKFIPSTLLALKMAQVFGTQVEAMFQLEDSEICKQNTNIKAISLNRNTFQLKKDEQILAQLVYENMFFLAAEITMENFEAIKIKSVGLMSSKMIVTKNEEEIANLHMNWKGKMAISLKNGNEYILKTTSLLSDKFILVNEANETLLELNSTFSWGSLSFTYDINPIQEPTDPLLLVLAVYAANYYMATMAAAL